MSIPVTVAPLAAGALSQQRLFDIVAKTLPTDAEANEKIIVVDVNDEGEQIMAAFKFRPREDDPHRLTVELQAVQQHAWSGDDSAAGRVVLRWK